MKYVFPSYYENFDCIGSKCKNNCCTCWEIDIDDETYALYNSADGEFGERLRKNICIDGSPHFILNNKRCPFLNDDNLCDIIINFGQEALCDICYSHPRFFNEIGERVEAGIGLCCEEASRLILSQKEPFCLVCEEPIDNETQVFKTREKVFEILQNRNKTIDSRIDEMLEFFNIKTPQKDIDFLVDELVSLEHLDEKWTIILQNLKQNYNDINFEEFKGTATDFETEFEQLLIYFVYRHFANAKDKAQEISYMLFALFGYKIIYTLCAEHYTRVGKVDFEDLVEFARMFSSEIEYSQDNFEKIILQI